MLCAAKSMPEKNKIRHVTVNNQSDVTFIGTLARSYPHRLKETLYFLLLFFIS